jgi:hypothetical protein
MGLSLFDSIARHHKPPGQKNTPDDRSSGVVVFKRIRTGR